MTEPPKYKLGSKISWETAQFLGVPFVWPRTHKEASGPIAVFRFVHTDEGLKMERCFVRAGFDSLFKWERIDPSKGWLDFVRDQDLYVVEGLDEKDQP